MDTDAIARLAKSMGRIRSRRSALLGSGLLGLMAALAGLAPDEAAGRKKKKKGKKPKKPKQQCAVVEDRCTSHNVCCSKHCCAPRGNGDPLASFCAAAGEICCPVALGGGACAAGARCCRPHEADPVGSCCPDGGACCPPSPQAPDFPGGYCCPASSVCCDTGSGCCATGEGRARIEGLPAAPAPTRMTPRHG